MNFEQARFNMIEQQILPCEVLNPAVVDALFQVRREQFVETSRQHLALADTRIPIGHGEAMLPPALEARLVNALQLKKTDKVLEVGTGSGFVAALLGACAGQVSSVEQRPEFVAAARVRLRDSAATNVAVHEGDGLIGLPGDAPFDAILISGALHGVPKVLLEQLKVGGRLVAVVGVAPAMQVQRITRNAVDAWHTETVFETVVPYLREPAASRFEF